MTDSVTTTPLDFPALWDGPFHPPASYADLRAEGPLVKVRLYDGRTAWAVTQHAEARALLADPRLSADKRRPEFPRIAHADEGEQQNRTFDIMDPPEHTVIRRMLMGEFTAKRAATLRPSIQATADELVDAMLREGPPIDLKPAFSLPMASISICHLLGVPYADHEFFEEQTRRLNVVGDRQAVVEALGALYGYLTELTAKKAAEPADDLISRLMVEQVGSGALTQPEVVSIAMVLLLAGHVTTTLMITLGTFTLFQHPEQLAALREDPSKMPGAVEELLRFLPVADLFVGRFATADIEIGDHVIRSGEGVLFLAAAINRDDAVYPDADTLDINRGARGHLTFGHGVHQCIGQNLARVEIETAFATLFTRIPDLRLAVPAEELMGGGLLIPDLPRLPVTW